MNETEDSKHYECCDCALGEDNEPCTVPYEIDELAPDTCPCGNGTDCKWQLKKHNTRTEKNLATVLKKYAGGILHKNKINKILEEFYGAN